MLQKTKRSKLTNFLAYLLLFISFTSSSQTINCLHTHGGNIYAATWDNGIYLSSDNGISWKQIWNENITPGSYYQTVKDLQSSVIYSLQSIGNVLYAGTSNGLFCTSDNGVLWKPVSYNTIGTSTILSFALIDSTLYIGTSEGLRKQTKPDFWSRMTDGLTNMVLSSLVINGTTFIAGTSSGIFVSKDLGNTWISSSVGLTSMDILSLLVHENTIYTGTKNGVFSSADNGTTWKSVSAGLPEPFHIGLLSVYDNKLFAGTNKGMYVSSNNGKLWKLIEDLHGNAFTSFTVNGESIFAGTYTGKIFMSTNKAKSWDEINKGLVETEQSKKITKADNYRKQIQLVLADAQNEFAVNQDKLIRDEASKNQKIYKAKINIGVYDSEIICDLDPEGIKAGAKTFTSRPNPNALDEGKKLIFTIYTNEINRMYRSGEFIKKEYKVPKWGNDYYPVTVLLNLNGDTIMQLKQYDKELKIFSKNYTSFHKELHLKNEELITKNTEKNKLEKGHEWDWVKSSFSDDLKTIGITSGVNGSFYVVGNFMNKTVKFENFVLNNAGSQSPNYLTEDIFLLKYDSSGNLIWARSAGGPKIERCQGIVSDKNGNVYIYGYSYGSAFSFGSIKLTNGGDFVAKYDSSGNVIWAKNINGSYGTAVQTDNESNFYLTGSYNDSTINFGSVTLTHSMGGESNHDMYIVKCDSSGNVIWGNTAGGRRNDQGKSIAIDALGNVFVNGIFRSPIIKFGTTSLEGSDSDISGYGFTAKYDRSGNFIWAQKGYNTKTKSSATDNKGNLYFIDEDSNISKIEPTGKESWSHYSSGSNTSGLFIKNDFIYVAGEFTKDTLVINKAKLIRTEGESYMSDLFIAKLDPLGNVLWIKGAAGKGNEKATGVMVDENMNIYLAGDCDDGITKFGNTSVTIPENKDGIFISKLKFTDH